MGAEDMNEANEGWYDTDELYETLKICILSAKIYTTVSLERKYK